MAYSVRKERDTVIIGLYNNRGIDDYIRLAFSSDFVVVGDEYTIGVDENRLVMRRPELGYKGDRYKAGRERTGYQHCVHCSKFKHPTIKFGEFRADMEESNEDQLVVYYEDKIV